MNGKCFDKLFVGAVATWLTATTFTQHPNRVFDRLRSLDRYTLVIPNWRFFAPNPATHDYIFAVRWRLKGEKQTSDWYMINTYNDRRLSHIIYYPNRRVEKSLSDVAGRVLTHLSANPETLSLSPDYKLLSNNTKQFVKDNVGCRVEKFQFMIAADTGYDTSGDYSEFYVSPGITVGSKGGE